MISKLKIQFNFHQIAGPALLALCWAVTLSAAAQTWVGPVTGTNSWTNAANWSPATVPNSASAVVVFSNSFSSAPTFTLDTNAITVNRLSFQDLSSAFLDGTISAGSPPGTLTFAGATPTVDTPADGANASDLVITCPVVLNAGLIKTGSRIATFSSSVTGGGSLTISNGTLAFSGGVLPAFTSGTIFNGGALEPAYNANITQTKFPLTISGNGPTDANGNPLNNTAGAIWFRNPTTTVVWPGAIILSGGAAIGAWGSGCNETFTGGISGTGPLLLVGGGGSSTSQTGVMTINTTACTYTGNTTIENANGLASFTVKLGLNNVLPTTTVLTLANALNNTSLGAILDLAGKNQTLAGLNNDNNANWNKYAVINSSTTAATLTISGSSHCVFTGLIGTNADKINLVVQGAALTLANSNQFTGTTTISSGKLVGVTGGACANSGVTVANGATLGVQILPISSQVLSPNAQWTCGDLTLNSGNTTNEFNFLAPPSSSVAPLLVGGNLTNNGRLNANIIGAGFVNGGQYPLIQYTGSLVVGTLGTVTMVNGGSAVLTNKTANHTIDMIVSLNSPNSVRVETAANGSGVMTPAQSIPTGNSITNFAVLRNSSGIFITNTPAYWVLTNITSGVNAGDLIAAPDNLSAVFTAHSGGSAQILAMGNSTNLIASGVITVVPRATVGIRLDAGSVGSSDYANAPNSYPVSKSGTTYALSDPNVFNTDQAIIEIGLYVGTQTNSPHANFDGASFVSAIQRYESLGFNVYGAQVYRECWLTVTNGSVGGAYTNDWRILELTDINNIRTAVANSTLRCKNSLRLIQLLGSGSAYFQPPTSYAGNNTNFPTFPPDELEYLRTNFDGLGLEVHITYEKTSPLALMAMADIAAWCVTNSKTTFVFMGGGTNTYTILPQTQLTYETLWQEMLANGVNYRSNDIIYWRQGARPGNMVPESANNTLSHQQAWVINALAGSSLFVSEVADQTVNNAVTSLVPFGAGEADLPGSAISVKATSSNQLIVTNKNLVITGRGFDRMLSITPNPAQSGVTTIALTASDEVLTVTNSFQLTVIPSGATTTAAANGGAINASATWGGMVPVAGDTGNWRTGIRSISMAQATDTFYGDTFEIQSNGTFAPNIATANLTLNNVILSGGTVKMANGGGLTLNLSGQQMTLNNGTINANSSTATIRNAILAGSGTINIVGSTSANEVQMNANPYSYPSVNTLGFTGVFNVATNGVLELPYIIPDDASFGLNISGTGLYANTENIAVTSLVIAGTICPPGVYAYTDFTPAQQAYLRNPIGVITVISTNNTPPVLASVANQTIIAGQTLTITNVATDTNVPAQTLTFSLPNPPAGATINPSTGIFTWRPGIAQSPSTNTLSVVVTDSGAPPLSATNKFTVTVLKPANPVVSGAGMNHGQFSFTFNGTNGPDYIVLSSTNLSSWSPLWTNFSPPLPFTFTNATTNFSQRFYRVLLGP